MSTDITGGATKEPTAVTEAVQAAVVPQEKPKEADAKLEQYAKRERQLLKMAREIKAREQAMQQKEQEWGVQRNKYETEYVPKNRFKEDPLAVLNETGVSYDALTQQLLNSPTFNDPVIKSLKGEIAELKQLLSQNSEQAQQATQQQYAQARKQIGHDIKLLVDGNESYQMIKDTGSHDAVEEYIIKNFEETGFVMDVEQAAADVEKHLTEEAWKMVQFKKVQERLKASEASAVQDSTKVAQKPSPTLTNAVAVQNRPRALTAKERIERAKLAFAGQLK